jgi:hypothetical protein
MKLRIAIVILILLFSVTTVTASDLISQEKIVGDIAQSIKNHPERWMDTGSRFVYCEDPDEMKRLRKTTWPEQGANLVMIYHFHTALTYVSLDKPFEYGFKGENLKEVIQEMKLYKLRKLQKEVGHLLNRKKKVEKKPEIKEEQIIKEGELRKL